MTDRGADSELFEQVILELLQQGLSVRFRAVGASMSPAIRDGDIVEVTPVIVSKLRKDDIVLGKTNEGFRLHRIVFADPANDVFITRGDRGKENDPTMRGVQILGRAEAKEVRIGHKVVRAKVNSLSGQILSGVARGQRVARKALDRLMQFTRRKHNGSNICALLFALVLFLLAPASSSSQVAVDQTQSSNAELTGTGIKTLTFSHRTTTTGSNLLLVVGVSLNITNQTAAAVTGIKYNGVALTLIGSHNDGGNTRRVEMWYLLNPPTGNLSTVVSVNIPSTKTVGVSAGATTFTGVDQTVPLGTFVSADGAAGTASQLDVPSVVNGMILDTLAIGGNRTATPAGPQVSQWNQTSSNLIGASNDPPDVTGVGSSRTGAPSVPLSEAFSNTSNWSMGAISINPTTADIGVTTSVSAVALGQNSTYNITITNNGLSAANSVVLTDTLASGLTLISTTPSAGTSCSGTGPITCTLPASLASGANATVAVVVKATTAGFYPNTASVTDSEHLPIRIPETIAT